MSSRPRPNNYQPDSSSYTYPQFIIDERTGQVEVNFIDKDSGRVVRYIPSIELSKIVQDYCSTRKIVSR